MVILAPPGQPAVDSDLIAIFHGKRTLIAHLEPVGTPPSGPQVGFAGIGKPWKVERALRDAGCDLVDFAPLPDHAPLGERTLRSLAAHARSHGAGLVTSEKDWIRLPLDWRDRITAWPVRVRFEDAAALDTLLAPIVAP